MTPDESNKTLFLRVLALFLGLMLLFAISILRDATTSLESLKKASGEVAEIAVSRPSRSTSYTLHLGLRGQPGLFGVYLYDDAATAQDLRRRLPAGSPVTVYYRQPWLFPGNAVRSVWQVESRGQVVYALGDAHRSAWERLLILLLLLGAGGGLWWWLRGAGRRGTVRRVA